ncbi:uncharacterized protein LOC128968811 [Indicator indicator]|uniref:uncharacterized protein LOC128968811 n=1 Tax=Indicator indicator TaxID=1002788 RepID=UPI0023DEA9D0|nr:uncharacterized protein LOC128968811 [Indicator indicator]
MSVPREFLGYFGIKEKEKEPRNPQTFSRPAPMRAAGRQPARRDRARPARPRSPGATSLHCPPAPHFLPGGGAGAGRAVPSAPAGRERRQQGGSGAGLRTTRSGCALRSAPGPPAPRRGSGAAAPAVRGPRRRLLPPLLSPLLPPCASRPFPLLRPARRRSAGVRLAPPPPRASSCREAPAKPQRSRRRRSQATAGPRFASRVRTGAALPPPGGTSAAALRSPP